MASINSVSITILFGAILVLAGIMSSLVALRFGAPLLLVFLLVGMLAGESGIGGIKFDDVRTGLYGRFRGARPDPVRRRPAHAACDLPQRAGAGRAPRHRRRPDHGDADGAGGVLDARADLVRGAPGRRRDGLDRRRRRVLPAPRQGPAAPPARQRHARGRIRHQRSVRDLPDHRPRRNPVFRRQGVDRSRRPAAGKGHHRRLPRLGRRPRHRAGAEPPGAAAGHARAVRRHRRAGDVRRGGMGARLRLPRGLCRRPHRRQPRDARPQHHRDVSRRRHLARADRHVRAARPARLARATCRSGCCRRSPWRWC